MTISVPHLPSNWKSTVQGFLSLAVIVGLSLQGSLAALAPSPQTIKVLTYLNIGIGVAKAVLGVFQHDAGTTTALVPGQSGVQVVPAHEVPNDPDAIPVAKP